MKRFGFCVAAAVLGAALAGCDSGGIKEGMPDDAAKASTGQPSGFKDMMEKQGKLMQNQKAQRRPPKSATPPPPPADAGK